MISRTAWDLAEAQYKKSLASKIKGILIDPIKAFYDDLKEFNDRDPNIYPPAQKKETLVSVKRFQKTVEELYSVANEYVEKADNSDKKQIYLDKEKEVLKELIKDDENLKEKDIQKQAELKDLISVRNNNERPTSREQRRLDNIEWQNIENNIRREMNQIDRDLPEINERIKLKKNEIRIYVNNLYRDKIDTLTCKNQLDNLFKQLNQQKDEIKVDFEGIINGWEPDEIFFFQNFLNSIEEMETRTQTPLQSVRLNNRKFYYYFETNFDGVGGAPGADMGVTDSPEGWRFLYEDLSGPFVSSINQVFAARFRFPPPEDEETMPNSHPDLLVMEEQVELTGIRESVREGQAFSEEYLQLGKDLFSALGIFVTTVKNPQLYATIINQQKGLSLYNWLKRRDANLLQSIMFKVNVHILKVLDSIHNKKFAFVGLPTNVSPGISFLNSIRINPDTFEVFFGNLDNLKDFRSASDGQEFSLAVDQNLIEISNVLEQVNNNFRERGTEQLTLRESLMPNIIDDLKNHRISLVKAQAAMYLSESNILTRENYGLIKTRSSSFSEGLIYSHNAKILPTVETIEVIENISSSLELQGLSWSEMNLLDITPSFCLSSRFKRAVQSCSSSIFNDDESISLSRKSGIKFLYDKRLLGNDEVLGKFFNEVPPVFEYTPISYESKVQFFLREEKILILNAPLFLNYYGRIPRHIHQLIFENREKLTLVPLEDFQENSFYQKLIDIYKTRDTLLNAEKEVMRLLDKLVIQKYDGNEKIKSIHQELFTAVEIGKLTPDIGLSIFGLGLAFTHKDFMAAGIIGSLELYQRVAFPILSLHLSRSAALVDRLGVTSVRLLSQTARFTPILAVQAYFMCRDIHTLLTARPFSLEHKLASLSLAENLIESGTMLLAPPLVGTIGVVLEMGAFSIWRGKIILDDTQKRYHILLPERKNFFKKFRIGFGSIPASVEQEIDNAEEQKSRENNGLVWLQSEKELWTNNSRVPIALSDSAVVSKQPDHIYSHNLLPIGAFFNLTMTERFNWDPSLPFLHPCSNVSAEIFRGLLETGEIECIYDPERLFKFYSLKNSEFFHLDHAQHVLIADEIVLPDPPFKLIAGPLNPIQDLRDNEANSDRLLWSVGQQNNSSMLRAITLLKIPEAEILSRAWHIAYDTQGKLNNFTLHGKADDYASIIIGQYTSSANDSKIKVIQLENNKIHIIGQSNQTNLGEQTLVSGKNEPIQADIASHIHIRNFSQVDLILLLDPNNFTKKIHCTQVKELNLLINYSPDLDLTTQVEISKEKIEFFNADQDLGQIMLSKATQRLPSLSISTACNVTITELIKGLQMIRIGENFSLTHPLPSQRLQISLEPNSQFIYGNNTLYYTGRKEFELILKPFPDNAGINLETSYPLIQIKHDKKRGIYHLTVENGQLNIHHSMKFPTLVLRSFYTYGNKTESIFCMWKEISSSDMCLLITSQNSLPARTIFAALDVDLIFMEGKFKNITPALLFNPDSLHQSLFQGLNVLGHEHEKLDLYYFKETLAIQALPSSLKTVNLIPWLNNDFPSLISMQPLYKIKTDNESLRLKFTSNITIILKQAFQSTNQIAFNLNNQTHYISTLENNNLECRITPLLNQNQSIETKLYSNQCSYDFSLCPPISNNINATMSRVTLCQTNLYPQTGNEIILFGGREMSIAGFQSFLLLKASARHSYLDASSHALALVSPPAGRITFENIDFIIPAGACASGFGGGLYQRATELGYGPRWLTQPIAQYTVNLILNYTSLLITYHLQPEEQREQIGMLEKSFIMGAPIASIMIGTWLQEKWGRVPTKLVNQLAFPLLVGCLKQGVGATLVSLSTNPIGLAMSFGLSSLSHAVGDFLGKQTLNVIDKVGQFFNNARGQYVVPETEMGVENANQDFTFFKSRKGLGRESVPMQGIPANDAEVSNRLLARERP